MRDRVRVRVKAWGRGSGLGQGQVPVVRLRVGLRVVVGVSRIRDGAHTAAVALHLTPHVVPIEGHRHLAGVRLRLRVRGRGSARLGLTLWYMEPWP